MIVSDQGPQFASLFWKDFCQLLGTTEGLSSGFYPKSNGQMERVNQELEHSLKCLASDNPSWVMHLVWVEYANDTL